MGVQLSLANIEAVRYACLNYHYAKRVPISTVAFNVYENEEWCGTIVYGYGANPHIASIYDKFPGQVLELVRMALNGKQSSTSECLSASLKEMKKRCPTVDLIVSYADMDEEHVGVIYQATNWIYVGLMNEGSKSSYVIHGEKMHPRSVGAKWNSNLEWLRLNVDPKATQLTTEGKHKYLYPLNKKMRRKVKGLHEPYPRKE